MGADTAQLTFSFPTRSALGREDFIVTPSNAMAADTVLTPASWPSGRLAIIGPAGAGKTHLAHVAMADTPAKLTTVDELTPESAPALAVPGLAVVEDVDRLADLAKGRREQAEDGLFHLFNLAASGRTRLLLTGRGAPVRWRIETPDLASRLQSVTIAEIAPPDDALLAALLLKLGRDRGLDIVPNAAAWVVHRVERSFAGIADAAGKLDAEASLRKRRRVTKALAAQALRGSPDKNAP
ncbi:MAG: DnaA/Hda family protein [Pseudomonadota bacterium]